MVVIVKVVATTAMLRVALTLVPAPSVTWTVSELDPLACGVPETMPDALQLSPAGRPAGMVQAYDPTPPWAVRFPTYEVPTAPIGSAVVVIFKAPVLTAMLSVAVALVPALSVTWTVNELDPLACGVPEMIPDALQLRPAGRLPPLIDQV